MRLLRVWASDRSPLQAKDHLRRCFSSSFGSESQVPIAYCRHSPCRTLHAGLDERDFYAGGFGPLRPFFPAFGDLENATVASRAHRRVRRNGYHGCRIKARSVNYSMLAASACFSFLVMIKILSKNHRPPCRRTSSAFSIASSSFSIGVLFLAAGNCCARTSAA